MSLTENRLASQIRQVRRKRGQGYQPGHLWVHVCYLLIRKCCFFLVMIRVYCMSSFSNKLVSKSLPVSITISPRDSSKIIFLVKATRSLFELICKSGLQFGVLPSVICHSSPCLIFFWNIFFFFLEYYHTVFMIAKLYLGG